MSSASSSDDTLIHLSESLGRIEGTLKSMQAELTRSVARAHERIDSVSTDVTRLRVQQGRLTMLATGISTACAAGTLILAQWLFGSLLP